MIEAPPWTRILDSLDLSFVVCGVDGEPKFLSSAGARLLHIRERDRLEIHGETLEPFRLLAARIRAAGKTHPFEPSPDRVEELNIHCGDGRSLRVVASGRVVEASGDESAVLLFSDIAVADLLLRTLASFQRSRQALVLTSVVARKPVGEVSVDDLRNASQYLANEFTQGGTRRKLQRLRCDLVAALIRAIDTVDPLLPDAFRILNEATLPLLVCATETMWIRLLVHLLLEAADYGGAFGRVRIAAQVRPTTGQARTVMLGFLVERGPAEIIGGAPIHRYLARKLRPTLYAVSHRSVEDSAAPSQDADVLQSFLGRDGAALLRESHRVSDEEYSENLRIVDGLAKGCGQRLRAQILKTGTLLVTLECPLIVETVSTAGPE